MNQACVVVIYTAYPTVGTQVKTLVIPTGNTEKLCYITIPYEIHVELTGVRYHENQVAGLGLVIQLLDLITWIKKL
ncbi:MAG: hypothetical protein C0172_04240 [Caldisphaera sp.]|nr:MAG: hypothetical protein C0172_04240 [Caldisphaera sp.]